MLKLLAPGDLIDLPPAPDDWYANLIWIDRRKCLLVVHADTLFPAFLADARKPQLANFGQYLTGTVATALADEGLPADCLGPLDPSRVQMARTASRHVLGVMNDMASMSERITAQRGRLRALDIGELNAFLARVDLRTRAALVVDQ